MTASVKNETCSPERAKIGTPSPVPGSVPGSTPGSVPGSVPGLVPVLLSGRSAMLAAFTCLKVAMLSSASVSNSWLIDPSINLVP